MTRIVKKRVVPLEDAEQIKLSIWLDKQNIKHFAIANGGYRRPMEAIKLKRMGVKKGVPDICIPISSYPYHGLYIELKRIVGGKITDEQTEWIEYLNGAGYYAAVAKGFDEAKAIVLKYLSFTPKAA